VRTVWPAEFPLIVRISTTDWVEGGWSIEESVQLAARLHACGVDLMMFLARELLRNSHWPLLAAYALGASITWPPQYERARLR